MSSNNRSFRLKMTAARCAATALMAAAISSLHIVHAAPPLSAQDQAAIGAIVRAVPEALNHKDMKAYAELFDDDADWINVVGMHWRGKANVVKAHTIYLKTLFSKGGMSTAQMSIRAVTADVAIAVVTENDKGGVLPDGSKAPPGSGRLTYVLVKRNGTWKITHGHNTGINFAAQRFDPINAVGNATQPAAGH